MVEKSTDPLYIYNVKDERESHFREYLINSNCEYQLSKIGDFYIYENLNKRVHYPIPPVIE